MPKELLPIAGKPLIQVTEKDPIAAGIKALIFLRGCSNCANEDHSGAYGKMEAVLPANSKDAQVDLLNIIIGPAAVLCRTCNW